MDIYNISDVEDYPFELVNPEFEQELSNIEPLEEELNYDNDEEVPEIASLSNKNQNLYESLEK
ncbi:hypothetical protein C1646_753770 [Rhizophagus diaphanus]|nr:hypothetical protein C1646_753770 [Rhizophagus diaphanus] [Rhizophagus sp. MUCL 43196]